MNISSIHIRRVAPIATMVLLLLCGPGAAQSGAPADTVYVNGTIYTVDSKGSVVESLAERGGVIIATGAASDTAPLIGNGTKVIDLKGRMAMPGLIDAHMHPLGGGKQLTSCSLNYASLTVDEVLAAIGKCLADDKEAPAGSFLQVQGWFRQAMMPAGADLNAALLDRLETDRPVVVLATDFHSMAANTAALKAAKIEASTPNPANGIIERDAAGAATGVLLDGAMWMVIGAAPPLPPDLEKAATVKDAKAALELLKASGVTAVLDAAADPENLEVFESLRTEGALTVRMEFAQTVSAEAAADPAGAIAKIMQTAALFPYVEGSARPRVSSNTIKVFADGVIQAPAQTGAVMEPYLKNAGTTEAPNWVPGEKKGELYLDDKALTALMEEAVSKGLRVHLHTDGDRAVNVALNTLEKLRAKFPGKDLRIALAHCELVIPGDLPRFAQLGALPVLSFQWGKPAPDTIDTVRDQIGPERFNFVETAGKFKVAGATIVFGSDWPVDRFNEWFAMEVALTRSNDTLNDPAYAGRLGDDPGLDIATAIRAFTINAAYSMGMENSIGSLETGKLADLIVLDRDIRAINPQDISETKVLMTVLGGQEIYRAAEMDAQ